MLTPTKVRPSPDAKTNGVDGAPPPPPPESLIIKSCEVATTVPVTLPVLIRTLNDSVSPAVTTSDASAKPIVAAPPETLNEPDITLSSKSLAWISER